MESLFLLKYFQLGRLINPTFQDSKKGQFRCLSVTQLGVKTPPSLEVSRDLGLDTSRVCCTGCWALCLPLSKL